MLILLVFLFSIFYPKWPGTHPPTYNFFWMFGFFLTLQHPLKDTQNKLMGSILILHRQPNMESYPELLPRVVTKSMAIRRSWVDHHVFIDVCYCPSNYDCEYEASAGGKFLFFVISGST